MSFLSWGDIFTLLLGGDIVLEHLHQTPPQFSSPPSDVMIELEQKARAPRALSQHSSVAQWQSIRLLTGGL